VHIDIVFDSDKAILVAFLLHPAISQLPEVII